MNTAETISPVSWQRRTTQRDLATNTPAGDATPAVSQWLLFLEQIIREYMAFYRLGNAAPKLLHSCRLGTHARTFLVTRLFPFVSNRLRENRSPSPSATRVALPFAAHASLSTTQPFRPQQTNSQATNLTTTHACTHAANKLTHAPSRLC
jgi:hypothetical protein